MSPTRKELLNSREYWLAQWQLSLFKEVDQYLRQNKGSKTECAKSLGVSKNMLYRILNGNADLRLSKMIELSIAIGKIPKLDFREMDTDFND